MLLLLLSAVINLSLLLFKYYLNLCFDPSPPPPHPHCLRMLFLIFILCHWVYRCYFLCIVINFLVLLSIFPHSSLVQFKNGSEYLTREATQLLISLIRFLAQNLGSRSSFVLGYSFLTFLLAGYPLKIFPSSSSSEFFISVLADGFSQEFKWQQISSSLQDSSQDSGRSQQCCHLDSLYSFANFQVLQAF